VNQVTAEQNIGNTVIQSLQTAISYLQQLHVLSQTQSLMLDECDYDGLMEIATSKQQIVDRIVALQVSRVFTDMANENPDDLHILAQQGNTLLNRISEVDRRNFARFERLRSEARDRLQVSRDERRLRSTYDCR